MTDEPKKPDLVNKSETIETKTQPDPATPVKPQTTEVLPKTSKPIEVNRPAEKEVKPVAKDPEGMFDYSNCIKHEVKLNCIKHEVKLGETLFDIAQKYVVALQQLRYFNHLSKENPKVRAGQIIYIPFKPINVPYGR